MKMLMKPLQPRLLDLESITLTMRLECLNSDKKINKHFTSVILFMCQCCFIFVDMETEATIFHASIMEQIAVSSQHRTMALPLTQTHCHLIGRFYSQMPMTRQMKASYMTKSHSTAFSSTQNTWLDLRT